MRARRACDAAVDGAAVALVRTCGQLADQADICIPVPTHSPDGETLRMEFYYARALGAMGEGMGEKRLGHPASARLLYARASADFARVAASPDAVPETKATARSLLKSLGPKRPVN